MNWERLRYGLTDLLGDLAGLSEAIDRKDEQEVKWAIEEMEQDLRMQSIELHEDEKKALSVTSSGKP